MRFKVGDRVKAIREHDRNTYIIGQTGIVEVTHTEGCRVKFDICIHGHGEKDRCWNIPYAKLIPANGIRTWDMSHIKPFKVALFIDSLNAKQTRTTKRRKKK